MERGKQEQRARCADQGEQHIRLGVPDVALAAKKIICGRAAGERRPPLDQFIKGADRQTNRQDQEGKPFAPVQNSESKQNFTRNHRGYESLHEVAETIVVIALPCEEGTKPIKKRHPRVSVMSADAQDTNVKRNESISQRREAKPAISHEKESKAGQARGDLQPPGKAIIGSPARPQNY